MNNSDRILKFRELISEVLSPLIDSDYVLLDVPNHPNIGDNLIWEGELQFLKNIPYKCIYSANVHNWEEDKIKDAKVILFHGGGNWGDLYRECQEHRIYIVNKYKDKRIIIFPQTVWYNNNDLIYKDSTLLNLHKDIHICVRDNMSYDLLSKYISKEKLYLLPDMAFYVDVQIRDTKTTKSLFMLRTDSEVDNRTYQVHTNCDIKDWPTFSNNKFILQLQAYWSWLKIILSKKLQNYKHLNFLVNPMYGLNRRCNRSRYITKGINFFSKYHTIYTTRLHGLILGVLMDKKMIIIDNKYNKCKNYYNTWLKEFDNIEVIK